MISPIQVSDSGLIGLLVVFLLLYRCLCPVSFLLGTMVWSVVYACRMSMSSSPVFLCVHFLWLILYSASHEIVICPENGSFRNRDNLQNWKTADLVSPSVYMRINENDSLTTPLGFFLLIKVNQY